ncbi:MAG TPA: phosphoglucosamine mutase [Candidatus Anoxymicrobiaceae bacterium]
MKKYFGTDGIRGEANRDLTPELALRLGRAAVIAFGGPGCRIVVGRDTRQSGPMLQDALVAGLLSQGATVFLAGVIPTPAVAFLTEEFEATSGVVISASHNQFSDNGIKFFGPGGVKLPDDVEQSIEELFEQGDGPGDGGPLGEVAAIEDPEDLYVSHLLECVNFDLEGYKIVLDCANGAAYRVCPRAFQKLGATVETLSVEPDGRNINKNCGSTNPETVVRLVKTWGADMGFALDGDADRCICVDETGEVRDGDFVMSMVAGYLKEHDLLHPPLVVSTVMSNLGFYHALGEMGVVSEQTRVGDRYVLERMMETGALLGGEQSGHIIFGEHASTGDGTLTALMVAGIVRDTRRTLSSLCQNMKKYPQVLLNVRPKSGRRLKPEMSVWVLIEKYQRELGERGRILVRSSGTEPVERVMVEATSESKAREVAGAIADAILAELDH